MVPTSPDIEDINPQLNSLLIQAPYDVQHQIFEYLIPEEIHLFTHEGTLSASECCDSLGMSSWGTGKVRREGIVKKAQAEERWARRLMSSWGTHWKCEEMMLQKLKTDGHGDAIDSMLKTCKKLRLDLCDYISHEVFTIVVTDIVTLNSILLGSSTVPQGAFSNIKSLEIILFLSKDVLAAIEMQVTGHTALFRSIDKSSIDPSATEQASMWLRIGPVLDSLKTLQGLTVWIDHNSKDYWWQVNESALLSPFAHLANRLKSHFKICLPRHANDDIATPPFRILRRSRQEYFGEIGHDGQLSVVQKEQFPLLVKWIILGDGKATEEAERIAWKRGDNMETRYREFLDDREARFDEFLRSMIH